jgi:hypothetical protein
VRLCPESEWLFPVLERQYPVQGSPFPEWFGQAWIVQTTIVRRLRRMRPPIQTGQERKKDCKKSKIPRLL